ncbi:MAG: RICIN domain-containing protein [Mediterraneibacter gnavus]
MAVCQHTFSTDDQNEGAKKSYKAIHIYLTYHNQVNQVLFKGVQLVRDDGESYQYDDDGNLINAVSAAEKESFSYDKKGSLTKMGSVDGTGFEYRYDTKNHLTQAANSEGVRYRFTYNDKGQPIRMTADGGKYLGAVIPGRVYYIREKVSGNYLDVKGGEANNAVTAQLYTFNGSAAQKWKLIDGKDGYMQFEPLCGSGYRLDLNNKSEAEGEKIQIYGNNNTDAQKWKLHPNADGSFQITSKATKDKKALTNGPKSTTSGQPVQSYTRKEENEHQDWYFEPADEGIVSAAPRSGGIYHIRVRHSGQYIDVKNASAAVGTQAVQFNYNGGMNQQYRLLPYDGTYYQLEPVHAPGKVLAKSGTNDRGFSILSLETAMSGAANQLFRFEEVSPGNGYTYQKDRVGHEVEFHYGDVEKQQKPGLGYGIKINGAQKIAYEYDALGRVIRTHNHFSDTNTSTQEYTYVSGKEAGVTTNLVASVREGNRAESYTYDACGNVETMVERSADGSERKIRYYYDALNQLVREDNQKQNKTICYTYDVGGNMVRRDEYRYTENPVITEAQRKSDTFEYQTGGWRDQLRFYNGQAITYDAMGNPLQYLGMQMEWEKGHQLRHITGAGLDMYCMYNDSGKRIRKTVNGVTTDFYLDGSAILMQTSSDGSRIDFFYDDKGNVFAMKYQNEMYFYRKNLFGDILGILDSHGTELVKYEYNSWGKLLNLTDYSSNGLGRRNPFRFKGYYYDEELGMYYLNSRYYDPEVGRFISPDTTDILEVQDDLYDKNLYAYCDNNPVMRIDSSGAVWHLAVGAVVGVATQFVADVGIGLATGSSFGEVISSLSLVDYAAAAIGGAIAASGIGFAGAVVANATLGGTTYLANCSYKGVKSNKKDFIASTVIGGVAGAIGGSGANGKNMRGVYSRSKQVINATKSVRKQAMYKAKVTGIKQNITKSTGKTVLAGIVSNVSNFFRRWFTKSDA